MDSDRVATGALAVGLLLIVAGIGSIAYGASGTEYYHTIHSVEESPSNMTYGNASEFPDGTYSFWALSERGKSVFTQTLEAYRETGDGFTLEDEEKRPPEFFYNTDAPDPGRGIYFIEYRGQYYQLSTGSSWQFFSVWVMAGFPIALFGVPLCLYGLLSTLVRTVAGDS